MSVYYKIIGHLQDDEQEIGTYIFNDEQPIDYIEKMFRDQLLQDCGYDSDSNKEVYIDFIFKSYQPIQVIN
tara:strand:+ start:272 stop:484 length:213 start_codon:yes stop_codon:yes gene_type:complete